MSRTEIVAEYDYYTLNQARILLRAEEKQMAARKREKRIEEIKLTTTLFICCVFPVMSWFLYWILKGYR